jgi:uncharacterized protein (TIGR02118 family)
MIKVVVLHPNADLDYNREFHAPLTAALPGLLKYTVSEAFPDPMTGEAPQYNLINTLWFDDIESYKAAFSSPEVEVAKADVQNFSDLSVTVTLVTVEADVPV